MFLNGPEMIVYHHRGAFSEYSWMVSGLEMAGFRCMGGSLYCVVLKCL